MRATGTFEVTSWDEVTCTEIDGGGKVTHASVKQNFAGDIAGEGAVEYLMCYQADGTASFVGLQHVKGQVGDRAGSFVLRLTGSFEGGAAQGEWSVVPQSGTEALAGLRGKGSFEAPLGPEATVILDYELD